MYQKTWIIVVLATIASTAKGGVTVTLNSSSSTATYSATTTPNPGFVVDMGTPIANLNTSPGFNGFVLTLGWNRGVALDTVHWGAGASWSAGANASGYLAYDVTYTGSGPTGWPGTDGYKAWGSFPDATFESNSSLETSAVGGSNGQSVTVNWSSDTPIPWLYPSMATPGSWEQRLSGVKPYGFQTDVFMTYHSSSNSWTGQFLVPIAGTGVTISANGSSVTQGATMPRLRDVITTKFGNNFDWVFRSGTLVGPFGTINQFPIATPITP